MHVEGIAELTCKLSLTFVINFCLHNGLLSLPLSFLPAWMSRNFGCRYFERKRGGVLLLFFVVGFFFCHLVSTAIAKVLKILITWVFKSLKTEFI